MGIKQKINGYEYQLCVYSMGQDSYLGMILVTSRDGIPFSPIVEIPTLLHFGTQQATNIEADGLAKQLIHTGAIAALLPLVER